jgi:hypothetical protein
MQKPASGPSPQQLEAYRREKLGTLYGRFFVAPGLRWPSEFNEDGVWQPLPPKKPAESIRLASEGAWLKKAIGAEFAFRAEQNSVTGPSSMAATASAYPNSDARNSEKEVPPLLASDVERLIRRLDIPFHLRRTLLAWWRCCTQPYGREIQMWKGVEDFAMAAKICPRTARYHLRHFERLQLIEVAKTRSGKRLVANTIRHTTTYRLRNETLRENRWPECNFCGHKHHSDQECGCDMGERRGSFYTKSGKRFSKVVKRTCRCKPQFHQPPTPIRPQRSSLPAQEPATAPSPATVAAPVPVAVRTPTESAQRFLEAKRGDLPGHSRNFRQLRASDGKELVAKILELQRGADSYKSAEGFWTKYPPGHANIRPPMSAENALTSACLTLRLPLDASREYAERCGIKFKAPEKEPSS